MSAIRGVLLAALCFRAFFPLGFMPAHAAGADEFQIVICTGTGAKTIAVDGGGEPVSHPAQDGEQDAPCAFASILQAYVQSLAPLAPLAAVLAPSQQLAVESVNALPLADDIHIQPRAPPVIATIPT